MRIAHNDVERIPVADMGLLVDIGWIREWPFEIRPAVVRHVKRHGWEAMMERAKQTAERLRKVGESESWKTEKEST